MKGRFRHLMMGFVMGCTMSVPGVSGGTTAMTLGYYGPMMRAASAPFRRGNLLFLLLLGTGGLVGFLSGANLLNGAFLQFPLAVTLLFCGAVLYGSFRMAKQALNQGLSPRAAVLFPLGFLTVLAVEKIPPAGTCNSLPLLILWGVFLAAGLILPGISTSHLLTVFGLYSTLSQWSAESLKILFPLGIGLALGTVLLVKPLSMGWERFPAECSMILLGFSVGSLKSLLTPCLQSPRLTFFPLGQGLVGLLLAAGACMLLKNLQKREKEKFPTANS